MLQVLEIRCKVENLSMAPEAAAHLAAIGVRTSLRYAVHLLTPASILAQTDFQLEEEEVDDSAVTRIELRHIQQVDVLFQDAKTSSKRLAREADFFIQ